MKTLDAVISSGLLDGTDLMRREKEVSNDSNIVERHWPVLRDM